MNKTEFIYVTYIKTTQQKLWDAITTPEFMKQYWFGTYLESNWTKGAPWRMVSAKGEITDAGEILEITPPRRLVIQWRHERKPELKAEGYSLCTFDIEPVVGVMKLTVTHSIDKETSKLIEAVSGGWPKILSNLKSLLETGQIVLEENVDCKASG
jgi:uncharacterized protein YndB with AHSA1/START domain